MNEEVKDEPKDEPKVEEKEEHVFEESRPPKTFFLKCACGHVCGQLDLHPDHPMTQEDFDKEHSTVCDDCLKK